MQKSQNWRSSSLYPSSGSRPASHSPVTHGRPLSLVRRGLHSVLSPSTADVVVRYCEDNLRIINIPKTLLDTCLLLLTHGAGEDSLQLAAVPV